MAPQPGRMEPLPRNARRIPTPAAVLSEWLAEIDNLTELKVALRTVALLDEERTRRDVPPSLSLDDLLDDAVLSRAAGPGEDSGIRQALGACLSRGTLVATRVGGEIRIWINDEHCRSHFEKARLSPLGPEGVTGTGFAERPPITDGAGTPTASPRANIFALYEKHIGTFGHGTAEQLRAAEEEYPASWIEDAFEVAAEQGARSWSYVRAILTTWQQQGKSNREHGQSHDYGKPGHDSAPDRRRTNLDDYRQRFGRLPWEADDPADGVGG